MSDAPEAPASTAPPGDPDADARRRTRAVIAATAAVLLLMLGPVFAGRYYVMDDIGRGLFPIRIYYVDHLQRGEDVAWSPHIYGGYYLLGDAHVGSRHPIIPLLYRALPLLWGFAVEILAHYPMTIAGAFLLLRRWGLPADASLFGAAMLGFGGFYLMQSCHPVLVTVAAHLPWLLWLADLLLRETSANPRRWAWLGVALLTGSQWLIGFPPTVYMSAQAELIYVVAVWARGRTTRVAVLAWALAKVVGTLIGAAQILPTLETTLLSKRADMGIDQVLNASILPPDVLQLFAPYWFAGRSYRFDATFMGTHELALYCGSATTILAAWALIRRRHLGAMAAWVPTLLVFLLAGLLLAMGRYGGLAVLQYYVPVVGKFRTPCRYILLAHVGLTGLAAMGLADLGRARSDARREPRALLALLLVPAALAAYLAVGFALNHFHPPARFAWRALSILTFLAAFGLVCAAARRVPMAFPLLVAFAMADLSFYAVSYYGRFLVVKYTPEILASASPLDVATQLRPAMTLQEFTDLVPPCPAQGRERVTGVEFDLNMARDLYSIGGYASLWPRQELDYTRPSARRVAGVRWELTSRPGEASWREVPGALPYARLLARAVADDDPRSALERIDPADTAVLDRPLDLPPGDPGAAGVVEQRPGRVALATRAGAPRLLVVAETYHPGWRAAVDGLPAGVLRAYGDFLAVSVPAGRRRVELEFRPWSLRLGPPISLAGLALALSLFAAATWSQGSRDSRDPSPIPA